DAWLRVNASPVAALTRSSQDACVSRRSASFSSAASRSAAIRPRAQRKTAPAPTTRPRMREVAAMSRRTVVRGSDGRDVRAGRLCRTASRQKDIKNQPRRVRRPTGAECRIRRLRRATGSDGENLTAHVPVRQRRFRRNVANCVRSRASRSPGREHPFVRVGLPASMDEVFGPGGALARALPDYEPRAEQAALAAAIEHALLLGEHLVAEAGTGVGKSLAYLVPALESGQRVVVATATKALQEQLLQKDVPVAAAAVGRPVDVQVLKGRANYLCRRQVQGFQPFLLPDGRDAAAWEAIDGWLDATKTGDRAELAVEPSHALWSELSVGPDRCSGRRCPFVSACFAEVARARAAEADLVIVNHALYFAHVASGQSVLPDHDAVVFDEAHRLEESAASWLGGRVSRPVLRRLAHDVERAAREAQRVLPARELDRVERAGERLRRAVAPAAGRRRLREVPAEPALVLIDALG